MSSHAALARQFGVSRAHVTQVLALLRPSANEQEKALALADSIEGNGVGIYTLLNKAKDIRGTRRERVQE